jgi:hypothetical protein
MSEEELNRLTFRKSLVLGNIEALKERARYTMNTLDGLNERIAGLENALRFINTALMDHFNDGALPNVDIIKIFDERDREKYMLKIDVGTDGASIYKILHNLDLALYTNSDTVIDKMGFMYRCRELACEYLKTHHNIASAIDNMEDYLSDVLPRFIESSRIERQLERELEPRRRF